MHFVGIDISKIKLDVCLFDGKNVVLHLVCKNQRLAIKKLFKEIEKEGADFSQTLICAEHTGLYCYSLIQASRDLAIRLWLENPAEIKLRSGVQRGKNDKIDAERIARYAHRYKDKAHDYQQSDETIEELSYLNSEREMLVTDRAKYRAQIKDQKDHMPAKYYQNKSERIKKLIRQLDKIISSLEKQMDELLLSNQYLSHQCELMTSIDGVGKQVAIQTIISTWGFTRFNNPRKFACHAGVAPFAYISGSSQRTNWKVSNKANKKLKKLFHMAALSAIQVKGELQDYYLRKVNEGKNKMTIINAIRSKIIHRIFAVIKNNEKYNKNYINSLDLSIR